MKVYNLRCAHDHHFEGWFSSAQDFQSQLADNRIACPVCESTAIAWLPSAPRLRRSQADVPPQAPDQKASLGANQFQQQVFEVVRQILARTEDVGDRFAEEARRIHYEETPERAIRGTATHAEREALVDEGIDVLALPSFLDEPLQ